MTNTSQVASLRPRGIGELLDQAIRLYRANFWTFLGIIAVVQIPTSLLGIAAGALTAGGLNQFGQTLETSPGGVPDLNAYGQLFGGLGVTLIVALLSYILVQGIGTAALTRAIADSFMGEPITIFGAYRKIKGQWGALIGALLLVTLLNIPFLIWTMIPCVGWLSGPGLMMFMSLVVVPLVGPIVVLEKMTSSGALRRAWDLARTRFWWIVGFAGALYLFNLLVVSGPVALISSVVSPLLSQSTDGQLGQILFIQTALQGLVSMLLSVLYVSLQATAMTLAYFDLRVRAEGFDLALLAASEGKADISLVDQMAEAPRMVSTQLIRWIDIGNFVLISLAVGAVYTVIYLLIMLVFGLGTYFLAG